MTLYSTTSSCFNGLNSKRQISVSGFSVSKTKDPINRISFTSSPLQRQFTRKSTSGDNGSPDPNESLVVCFGEMLIDFVPTINVLALAEAPTFRKAPGGAPANVVVGIARLGGSSAFIGKVAVLTFQWI